MDWSLKYRCPEYIYGTNPNDFLREASRWIPEQAQVLSLAEGEGRNAVFLAQQGHHVLGVDYAGIALDKARTLAYQHGVSIRTERADLADYVLGKQRWQAIVAIFCHLAEPVRSRVFRQVADALVPGGIFIFEAYHHSQLAHTTGGPKDIELLYELNDLMAMMPDLEWLHSRQVEREIHEGQLHCGVGAVVQLIGRKPLVSN